MPTGGTARFASPLNVDDFLKISSVFSFSHADLAEIGPPAAALARSEGLYAHARAIEYRIDGADGS
jgi:histidinol dehydrogenase